MKTIVTFVAALLTFSRLVKACPSSTFPLAFKISKILLLFLIPNFLPDNWLLMIPL